MGGGGVGSSKSGKLHPDACKRLVPCSFACRCVAVAFSALGAVQRVTELLVGRCRVGHSSITAEKRYTVRK